jgi:SAM-dependent methyltransferase
MHDELGIELTRGLEAYNGVLGRWWEGQASDAAHLRAYCRVADFIALSFPRARVILDYACGAGNLLQKIQRRCPSAQLIGLDGSEYLLALARGILNRKVRLIRSILPDFALPMRADVVVFAFPNLLPASKRNLSRLVREHLEPIDFAEARSICRSQPGMRKPALLQDRLVAKHLRTLLKRGGHCVRVEYASIPRDRIGRDELFCSEYEEGALIRRASDRPWFRVAASSYFRSGVIADVYDQTGDSSDLCGGYQVTVLRAL